MCVLCKRGKTFQDEGRGWWVYRYGEIDDVAVAVGDDDWRGNKISDFRVEDN